MRGAILGLGLLAAALFGAMQIWTLPHLTALAGAAPFDLRLSGYSLAEARSLLTAYGPAGRAYYTDVQQRLDMIFPLVFGLMLILGLRQLAPRRAALVVLPILFIAADYAENALLRRVLRAGPDNLGVTVLHWASLATQIKFAALVASVVVLAAFLVLATRRRA
jgi:hypothetical protein